MSILTQWNRPLCPFPLSGCGGVLTDSEGSFSSPNHPGSYPPNLLCVWVIRVPPTSVVQVHVSSLAVEGPSPCLFDWLEVQEQIGQTSVVTRLVRALHCTHSHSREESKKACSVLYVFYPQVVTVFAGLNHLTGGNDIHYILCVIILSGLMSLL